MPLFDRRSDLQRIEDRVDWLINTKIISHEAADELKILKIQLEGLLQVISWGIKKRGGTP